MQDAIDCCKELIANGTRNQKLVVSYYNIALQHKAYTMPIASQILETYPQDIELCTASLPTYLPDSEQVLYCACYGKNYNFSNHIYHPISWDTFHLKKEQAKTHFFLWKNIYQMLPKKGYLYSPCIFPWYYVSILPSQAVYYMALFAYMLQEEELIDQVCPLISKIDPSYRDLFLCLLLHHPKTKLQQQTLLQALSDKHYNTRECAFSLIKNLNLEEKDYQQLLLLLKYKSADTRNYVLDLLEKQKNPELSSSITALFTAKKEEMHLGGLDLLVRLKKDPKRNTDFQTCCTLLSYLTNPTEKEAIIISELTNSSQTDSILNQKGYGLYNPDVEMTLPIRKTDPTFINQLFQKQKTDAFPNKKEELFALLDQLETLYTQNQNLEYKTYQGEERLLDNIFCPVSYEPSDYLERYPFPELWRKFYYEQIKDFSTLVNLYFFVQIGDPTSYEQTIMSYFLPLAKQIYGDDYLNIDFDFKRYPHFNSLYRIIYNLFHSYSKQEGNRNLLLQAACSLFTFIFDLPVEESIYIVEKKYEVKTTYYALKSLWFSPFFSCLKNWKTDFEFDQMFFYFQSGNQFLYDSAKYISDTNKHTRARKYSDSALGKITVEELETIIQDKQNKDSLMSYALVPIKNEKDILHRYQFLQQFLKESKQFGAQRKASEGLAVSTALQNLATNTGYSDVTRLTLNIEAKLAEYKKACFQWQSVDDIQIKIQIQEDGKPSIVCEKNEKTLKSIPAKYKKQPAILELKENCKQFHDQFSRTKTIMEQFMEDGTTFTVSEIVNLQKNRKNLHPKKGFDWLIRLIYGNLVSGRTIRKFCLIRK